MKMMKRVKFVKSSLTKMIQNKEVKRNSEFSLNRKGKTSKQNILINFFYTML